HGKAALLIVENQPVLAAAFNVQRLDLPFRQLHGFPKLAKGPQRVRGPLADPPGWRFASRHGAASQKVSQKSALSNDLGASASSNGGPCRLVSGARTYCGSGGRWFESTQLYQ